MKDSISTANIKNFNKNFKSNPTNKIARNALTRSQIDNIAMDWDAYRMVDHTYSDVVSNEMKKVTNQKASGRCWGFAGLNLMRISLAEKYNLVVIEDTAQGFGAEYNGKMYDLRCYNGVAKYRGPFDCVKPYSEQYFERLLYENQFKSNINGWGSDSGAGISHDSSTEELRVTNGGSDNTYAAVFYNILDSGKKRMMPGALISTTVPLFSVNVNGLSKREGERRDNSRNCPLSMSSCMSLPRK